MNISTRQLQAFVTLAAQRNFTRAAAACHLSQPAFSAQIAALERQLGARLFDRTTRSVELSAEGRVFEASAQRLLDDARQALADVRAHAQRERGRVAIAVLPALAAGWLPALLAGFHARHPGIELDVADVLSEDCIARVRDGKADFALAALRADTPALRTEAFCADRFHLVCPIDHPLARKRRVALSDLAGQPIVQLARSSSVRQYLEAAVAPQRLTTVLELDQLATVAGMVRAGLGVTVVPALTLFHFRDPALAVRPLGGAMPERQIFLLRRRDRGFSSAAQALYELAMRQRPRVSTTAPASQARASASSRAMPARKASSES
ncbi:MAG: LysR family transcriptional regulator [Burkholderiales bacterium]|nr:LysR family transcriptional regulator [Burkholderiales bacterium]